MAEINTAAAHSSKRGVRRSKKHSTRVDLTPMVDLGFLLITFFIFTTTMSMPRAAVLRMPADGPPMTLGESASLTLVALDDDKVFYYFGDLDQAIAKKEIGIRGYGMNGGIGDVIRAKQVDMDRRVKGGRAELMLLIKPTKGSSYRNVVQLLDEAAINDVKKSALLEPVAAEEAEATRVLHSDVLQASDHR